MRIEYHRTLIADKVRNEAFYKALKAAIVPGRTIVADIGAGTGVLGLMASKLGAREVLLFEVSEVAGVAAKVLKANRAKNCQVIPCHSTEFHDPPRVDVVVSETLGNYAFEEHMIATLHDARMRYLRYGGVMIPSRVTQFVAPVVVRRIDHELRAWERVGYGIDLSAAQTMSLNNAYVRAIKPADLLDGVASAKEWDTAQLGFDKRTSRKGEASWKLAHPATIYGFACWWQADLGNGITLSTAPDAPRTHWEQLYYPLLSPLQVQAGEAVMVSLRSQSSQEGGTDMAWTAVHFDAQGRSLQRQALDLDKGYLP
ncbi:MAG TPA: 50S ribosomal protein L11 methyltransferase [Hyphomicrobium sp.]|nr:50S ribosomal protein L11 methyltransferase [Hyphomicrobium sp.]